MVRARSARQIDWSKEESVVVLPAPEIILANRTAGRELRRRNHVRAISPTQPCIGLLNSGINAEWCTGHESGHVQKLPSGREGFSQRPQETHPFEPQELNDTRR